MEKFKTVVFKKYGRDRAGRLLPLPVEVTEYDAELLGNKIVVNGKWLPIEYQQGWSVKVLKTKIKSVYEPSEFWKRFFGDDAWYSVQLSVCQQVCETGRVYVGR